MRLPRRAHPWLLAFSFSSGAATTAQAATRYVFTTFLGDGAAQEKLSVYTSTDGLTFKLLSDTGYGGPTGVLRDPSILKHSDGKYYLAYTLQSWTTSSTSFGIATSTNLEDWTFLVEVPAGVTSAHDTWAPEWFTDGDGVHLIVNIDTLGNDSDFRSYDFRAKDDTLKSWDPPVELGIGPNNIDTFVVKSGATYHAFSKNESTKYIEHATASSFHGPWTWVGKADWAGWGSGKEGIALFQLDDGTWRMFLDCYGGCGFLYADSKDLLSWSSTKTAPGGLSGVVRHGTVLREETGAGGMGAGGMGAGGMGAGGMGAGGAGAGGMGAGGAGRAGAAENAGRGSNGGNGGGRGGMPGAAGTKTAGSPGGGGFGVSGGAGDVHAGDGGRLGSAGSPGGAGAGASASGATGTGGATPSMGGAGNGAPASSGDGCGCALPTTHTRAPWLAGAGWLLFALRRRRRSLSR